MVDNEDKKVVGECSDVWRRWRYADVEMGTTKCGERRRSVGESMEWSVA